MENQIINKRINGNTIKFVWDKKQDVDVIINDEIKDHFCLSIDDVDNMNLIDATEDFECRVNEYIINYKEN